ncbi:Rhodanese-like domain-containing protein 19 [Hibiscus syriacus]|uniref:Rhodanese-like domain-containing protein 19 n=1 Tax=Hibiscus syriacus TaxID=106335 RepID=A0A6A2ZZ70_HIBSY|nr:Rhodanese-like domain-containing protein 19 [Hibiscus syriacus]
MNAGDPCPTGSMGRLIMPKCSGSQVVTLDVVETKHLIQSGYVYIDVRTVEEYKKGRVEAEKILNIPYLFSTPEGRVKNPEFLKEVSSICKEDDPLILAISKFEFIFLPFLYLNDVGIGSRLSAFLFLTGLTKWVEIPSCNS